MTAVLEQLIDFGFRFNRRDDLHTAEIVVRRRLAAAYAARFPSSAGIRKVELYPVSRAGNSGSEVFYCDIFVNSVSFPKRHVAKFQKREDTKKEYTAALDAHFGEMCAIPFHHLDEEQDLGIIVYDLAKAPNHREFRGLFLDLDIETDFCGKALEKALRDVAARRNDDKERQPIYVDFERYLNRSANPIGKLKALALANDEWASLRIPAQDALRVLDQIKEQTDRLVLPFLVHGDLHARNLIIDVNDAGNTELIDFDWVHYGHPAKDIALMEATLKYMLLAELVQKQLGKQGSMSFDAFCVLEAFLIEHGFDLPDEAAFAAVMAPHLASHEDLPALVLRTYACIVQVRSSAKVAMARYCAGGEHDDPLDEYFTGLFLVTLGLFGFPETERFWALAGLQLLALNVEAK